VHKFIIIVFGILIVLSYKPRKVKEVINNEFNPAMYKLSKIDAG